MAVKNSKTKKVVEPKIEIEAPVIEVEAEPVIKVEATCPVNVRVEPIMGTDIIRVNAPGTIERVIGEKDGWYEFADGGFSMKEFYK